LPDCVWIFPAAYPDESKRRPDRYHKPGQCPLAPQDLKMPPVSPARTRCVSPPDEGQKWLILQYHIPSSPDTVPDTAQFSNLLSDPAVFPHERMYGCTQRFLLLCIP